MQRRTLLAAGLALVGGLVVLTTLNLPDSGPDHRGADPIAVSSPHRPATEGSGPEAGSAPAAQPGTAEPVARAAREGGERRALVRSPAGRGGESAGANRSRPIRRGVRAPARATVPGEVERERERDREPRDGSTPPVIAGSGGSHPPNALGGAAEAASDSTPLDDPTDLPFDMEIEEEIGDEIGEAESGGTAPVATREGTLGAIAELVVLHTNWIEGEASDPVEEAIADLSQLQAGSQGATPSELELAIDRVLAAGEQMLAYNDDVAAADHMLAARDAIRQGRFAEAEETIHGLVGAGD